jgi:outer membrane immunogenic protein
VIQRDRTAGEVALKRSLCVCATILSLAASPAFAASPGPSWTGCYIDGAVGYGFWKQNHYTETYPPPALLTAPTNNGGDGWLGSLGAGCDYQATARFIVGAFGDYDFTNLNGSSELIVPGTFLLPDPTFSGNQKESAAWSVGGRFGFLLTNSLMAYVNGGYTQARFDQVEFGDLAAPFTSNIYFMPAHTYQGWFIGGGTEYVLDSDWIGFTGLSWRTEYRFSSYGSADLPVSVTASGAPTGLAENVQHVVQTVTAGVVWRFNFGAPVGNPPLATKY